MSIRMSNKIKMSKELRLYPAIILKSYYMIMKRARRIIDELNGQYFDYNLQKKYKYIILIPQSFWID